MDEIMTLPEVQAYLKIPRPTIYAMAQGGRIPAAKIGKHWRFRKSDIDQWIETQKRIRPRGKYRSKPTRRNANYA